MEIPRSLKAARAVDGDDWWVQRLTVMCELAGVEYTRDLALRVSVICADKITVDEFMTVDTQQITDQELIAALEVANPGQVSSLVATWDDLTTETTAP